VVLNPKTLNPFSSLSEISRISILGSPICPYVYNSKNERTETKDYDPPAAYKSEVAIGFLGRVKLWLRIIFSGFGIGQMQVKSTAAQSRNVANRHKTRLHKRALPLARRGDLLAHHMMRRYGRARFLNWIYNRTLTPRVRWCFTAWNWAWQPRMSFAGCDLKPGRNSVCFATLRPD